MDRPRGEGRRVLGREGEEEEGGEGGEGPGRRDPEVGRGTGERGMPTLLPS